MACVFVNSSANKRNVPEVKCNCATDYTYISYNILVISFKVFVMFEPSQITFSYSYFVHIPNEFALHLVNTFTHQHSLLCKKEKKEQTIKFRYCESEYSIAYRRCNNVKFLLIKVIKIDTLLSYLY